MTDPLADFRAQARIMGFPVRRLTYPQMVKNAEMALCMSLPDYADVKPGRIQSLYESLSKACVRALSNEPVPDEATGEKLVALLERFGAEMGWMGAKLDVCAVVSFLLGILDGKKEYSAIIEILMKIYDHFDRINDVPDACPVEGQKAEEKWKDLLADLENMTAAV